MQKQFKMSEERYRELEKELHYLKTVREQEVAEQIKEARKFGDLSENSEYDEAKNEQGKVFSRILELEGIIAGAVIIQKTEVPTDRAGTGCRVTVQEIGTNETETYTIVGSQEANPMERRISDESPFGQALSGRQAGEEFTVDVPAGRLHYRVVEIQA